MTPEQLAASLIEDVPLYGWDGWQDDNGEVVEYSDVLAALARAMEPKERPDAPCHIVEYTNYRGETARRVIIPIRFWWGSTEWHPQEQWMLSAWDVEKNARRDFAWQDMRPVQNSATSAAVAARAMGPDDLVTEAGKVLDRLRAEKIVISTTRTFPSGDERDMVLVPHYGPNPLANEAADLITTLLARIAAQEAQIRAVEAERDELATANHRQASCIHVTAANLGPDCSATVDGLPKAARHVAAERDALLGAVKGLVEVLDQHETKGPLPDTALMFCWLAAQNVRAVLRGYMLEKPE